MSVEQLPEISGKRWRVIIGDVRDALRTLPDASVHCCVTSPPYFGLRDYQTGTWEGGDPSHKHETRPARNGRGGSGTPGKQTEGSFPAELAVDVCSCGARRIDRQIGLEKTPEEFIAKLVAVFAEVHRVMRDDGVLFVNMGDSYASSWPCNRRNEVGAGSLANGKREARPPRMGDGLKEKDLMGIPWRLALALQAWGWYLRQDIIWHKRSPMPESVTDRCTKAHEYIFLLTKSPRYFWDQEAVAEEANPEHWRMSPAGRIGIPGQQDDAGLSEPGSRWGRMTRNPRSVWTLSNEPFADAHFATFPSELPRRCIKAGTSERGCCPSCGAPWRRVTEKSKRTRERPNELTKRTGANGTGNHCANTVAGVDVQTTGWQPSCDCGISETVPCRVLDCFSGSGTTGMVATELGREYIGIELSEVYARMSAKRIDSWKFRDAPKQPEPLPGQGSLFD